MSGHSKWSTIKRKKGLLDAQKSSTFSKMSRLLTVAVHEGGGIPDPEKNIKLRLVVERAKAANMPKDTIQRAIDKAIKGEGSQLREVLYEGFGPMGVSLLILGSTDNPNRSYAEVKHVLDKSGGKMANQNAVLHQFAKCALVTVPKKSHSEEDALGLSEAIEAFDMEDGDEDFLLYISFEDIGKAGEVIRSQQDVTLEPFYKPSLTVDLTDEAMDKLATIIEKLEDLDDIETVFTNVA